MSMIEGFILVGGRSSRMGTDKALLTLGEQNFVERIEQALTSIADRVTLVGSSERCAAWPQLPNIPDIHVEWGALGGLHAALSGCRAEWAAIVACDLPFVSGELFARLAALREDFDSVVPIQADGRWQPLCALYRISACCQQAERLITLGARRPRELLQAINMRPVAPSELSDLRGAERFFMNVNTPADYATAQKEEQK